MTPEQAALVERVRTYLTGEAVVREVSMFGGRSFMVNEKMIVSALRGGSLLVRVSAERHRELLTRRGAMQAEMGPGRHMGPGWIEVKAEAIGNDRNLSAWIGIAMEYNGAVTAGISRARCNVSRRGLRDNEDRPPGT